MPGTRSQWEDFDIGRVEETRAYWLRERPPGWYSSSSSGHVVLWLLTEFVRMVAHHRPGLD
jgi:hypothetical protein